MKEIINYIYSIGIIRGNINQLPYTKNDVEEAIDYLESCGLAMSNGDLFTINFAPDADWSTL